MPASKTGVELERLTLANGLRVVVAPDPTSALVGVAVAYDVGWRSEPDERTGFAHLFEHMMFQGSAHVAKVEHMRLLEAAGGVFNGHTMADVTSYYEALPAGGLELALWLEAERMGSLVVTEENLANQVSVVKEEINVNVLNQPYGGFPWILLPEIAFDTYHNAHNGYGAFEHLEKATVADAQDFYERYYAPSNAVVAVSGGCEPEEVALLAERHFAKIAGVPAPDHGPWLEPALTTERRRVVDDLRAPQPALAAGFRTPDPIANLQDHVAYAVAAMVLGSGEASRLRSRLMHRDRTVTDVSCALGIFGIDNFFMRAPVLFQLVMMHPGIVSTDELLEVAVEELGRLAVEGPSGDELERVSATFRSAYWRGLDSVMERSIALAQLEVIHGRAELLDELPDLVTAVEREAVVVAAADLAAQRKAIVEIVPGDPHSVGDSTGSLRPADTKQRSGGRGTG
ncbi:MAG: M16 family metallopeptidase [Acidimicrobiales bacterium]